MPGFFHRLANWMRRLIFGPPGLAVSLRIEETDTKTCLVVEWSAGPDFPLPARYAISFRGPDGNTGAAEELLLQPAGLSYLTIGRDLPALAAISGRVLTRDGRRDFSVRKQRLLIPAIAGIGD